MGLWLPQPVEDEFRSSDRRAVGRRRWLGIMGNGLSCEERRQLWLVGHGRPAAGAAQQPARADADFATDARFSPYRGGLDHRRLRLPRQTLEGPGWLLCVRRLCDGAAVGNTL